MPRGDRTGPLGWGPMTGRAAGYCSGYTVPGYLNPTPGRGFAQWAGYGDTVPYGGVPAPAGYPMRYAPFQGRGYGVWPMGRRGFGFGRGGGFGRGRGPGGWGRW